MRILQIIPTLTDGGAERFVVDLSNQLAVNKNTVKLVSLYTLEGSRAFYKDQISELVEVEELDKQRGFDWGLISNLKRIVRDFKPDIVHTHVRALNYILPLLLIGKTKFTVIHTVHNDAFKEVANKYELKVRYWFYRNKKVIPVTISEKSYESFLAAYPSVNPYKIYNGRKLPTPTSRFEEVGLFIERLKSDADTKIFVHIGRLMNQKNQLLLLEAFTSLHKEGGNAALVMIGGSRDTQESKNIENEVKKYCNDRIVWIGGNQPSTDYLMFSDFFCLSSIFEGMPISLLEAMAVGSVPICTPVGGIPELITGKGGILSTDVSLSAYTEAIRAAYNMSCEETHNRREKLKTVFGENYSIEICSKMYENVFKKEISE